MDRSSDWQFVAVTLFGLHALASFVGSVTCVVKTDPKPSILSYKRFILTESTNTTTSESAWWHVRSSDQHRPAKWWQQRTASEWALPEFLPNCLHVVCLSEFASVECASLFSSYSIDALSSVPCKSRSWCIIWLRISYCCYECLKFVKKLKTREIWFVEIVYNSECNRVPVGICSRRRGSAVGMGWWTKSHHANASGCSCKVAYHPYFIFVSLRIPSTSLAPWWLSEQHFPRI